MQHRTARLARLTGALALCLPICLHLLEMCAWAQDRAPQSSPPPVTEQQSTPEQMATPQTPSPSVTTGEASDKSAAGSTPVKLGPGDLVEVNVYGVPELATKARVSNDGDLYLPLIDYVHVDGLSHRVPKALANLLGQILLGPRKCIVSPREMQVPISGDAEFPGLQNRIMARG